MSGGRVPGPLGVGGGGRPQAAPAPLGTTAAGALSYGDFKRAVLDQQIRNARAGSNGLHGRAAVEILARHVLPWKAAPGFSNHSNGTAVDFTTTFDGVLLTDKSARETWRGTWLHAWLVANAGNHRFHALASEEWHWDYR